MELCPVTQALLTEARKAAAPARSSLPGSVRAESISEFEEEAHLVGIGSCEKSMSHRRAMPEKTLFRLVPITLLAFETLSQSSLQ
jgi:hypothetical protein